MLALPLSVSVANAQAIELPSLSLKARVEQRVGLTDFAIDYSSPAVKRRKIWGELVPFDKVWRAGANASTKLIASRDFQFGGAAVKAGTYAIFMIPGKASWSVHLNSDLTATQNDHDAKKDVAKVVVKPTPIAARERLLYIFNDAQDDRVSLDMEWEKVRIRVPITVETKAQVTAAIEKATNEAWRPHFQSANYLNETGELDRALALVDRSIAIQSTWRNEWLRAQIMKKKGKKAEAVAGATKAAAMGKGDPIYEQFFKEDIAKAIAGK